MFLRGSTCLERTEVPAFACLRIFLDGIETILSGFQFSYHDYKINMIK